MNFVQPVFRFAPSPNGFLHLGHAYSALLNEKLAREAGGKLLLRIEDIDPVRCTDEKTRAVLEDLDWLGIRFEGEILYQSHQMERYKTALMALKNQGLLYACTCSRQEIARSIAMKPNAEQWPRDPDGAPFYPRICEPMVDSPSSPFALRLAMERALKRADMPSLFWQERGQGRLIRVQAEPALWGDVVLARKETPTSYHLAVVVDDAMQGVTDVVRGRDLYAATSVHRLVQQLLHLPAPRYHHHALIVDEAGQKLAKSLFSTPLRHLRAQGATARQIRDQLGFA